jgi:hypothetical protein
LTVAFGRFDEPDEGLDGFELAEEEPAFFEQLGNTPGSSIAVEPGVATT